MKDRSSNCQRSFKGTDRTKKIRIHSIIDPDPQKVFEPPQCSNEKIKFFLWQIGNRLSTGSEIPDLHLWMPYCMDSMELQNGRFLNEKKGLRTLV
jgi:hypothetical protein